MGWMSLQYIHAVHKVQKSLVAALRLTIAARSFNINPYAARGVKKVDGTDLVFRQWYIVTSNYFDITTGL